MPPLAIVVPLAVPPIATTSKAPSLTVVPVVTPPDDTVIWPPLLTVASTDVPPERRSAERRAGKQLATLPDATCSMTPEDTTVPLAAPPRANSRPPDATVAPTVVP